MRSLYRDLLREARALQDTTAREHFTRTITTRLFSRPLPSAAAEPEQFVRLHKAATRLLRRLQAANDGYLHAVDALLQEAYGLRGYRKHTFLAPFAGREWDPATRHPALTALLTSAISASKPASSASALSKPPTLPPRAEQGSEAARLLGLLPRERRVAITKRFVRRVLAGTSAPLRVELSEARASVAERDEELGQARIHPKPRDERRVKRYSPEWHALATTTPSSSASDGASASTSTLERPGHFAQNDSSILAALEEGIKVPDDLRPNAPRFARSRTPGEDTQHHRPRKLRRSSALSPVPATSDTEGGYGYLRRVRPSVKNTKWGRPHASSARFWRRRHLALLQRAPVLVVEQGGAAQGAAHAVRYKVERSDKLNERVASASEEDAFWHGA